MNHTKCRIFTTTAVQAQHRNENDAFSWAKNTLVACVFYLVLICTFFWLNLNRYTCFWQFPFLFLLWCICHSWFGRTREVKQRLQTRYYDWLAGSHRAIWFAHGSSQPVCGVSFRIIPHADRTERSLQIMSILGDRGLTPWLTVPLLYNQYDNAKIPWRVKKYRSGLLGHGPCKRDVGILLTV